MHPADAGKKRISEGTVPNVISETGNVRVSLKCLSEIMTGFPYEWGQQCAAWFNFGSKTIGAHVNILPADGSDNIERVFCMAHLTGIIVEVEPVAGILEPLILPGIIENKENGIL